MIRYIKGKIEHWGIGSISVEIQSGVAFDIFVPDTSGLNSIPSGDEVQVFTSMVVREDSMKLYGFETRDEVSTFELLISVSGIGAKGAMAILSVLKPKDLYLAIKSGDSKSISKANGVGEKTAKRLILELKDKMEQIAGLEYVIDDKINIDPQGGLNNSLVIDNGRQMAIEALISLGYSMQEAKAAVSSVADEGLREDEYIKRALGLLMRG